MTTDRTFIIVGASLTGAKAAERLREDGFDGRIVLVGAEQELPYERPPLSKSYLLGKEERATIYVHDEQWYLDNAVELRLGRRATHLDLARHEVTLDDETLRYTKLLLATGASARRLVVPGSELDGVLYLRTVQDSDALREVLDTGGRIVVVGGGWIGLEAAAAARSKGCDVTVVDPRHVPLHAALGEEMGAYFADVHRRNGVDLRLRRKVTELRGAGRVSSVHTDDGAELPADVVVVGVGVTPNTELAEQAGLVVHDGVVVDEHLRTANPDVYAAGDVARSHVPKYATTLRTEHWSNAMRSGPVAARSMLGQDAVYDRLPYFFSDQYDVGMEFTGWFPRNGYHRLVVRGDQTKDAFYAFWLRDNRPVAGMQVNSWDDGIKPVEDLIEADVRVDPERLVDPSIALTDLADNDVG
jgi:3-phenylpropionate/trans-cinnamate dioxygenase ferredoxin reductase component